jgi:hypothetical protein
MGFSKYSTALNALSKKAVFSSEEGKSAIEQSIKEKIKALAKERESTFTELWRNLI